MTRPPYRVRLAVVPESRALTPWLTPERRGWLYRVSAAVAPLLVAYGALTDVTSMLWLGLANALLSTGVAAAHTPTR